MCLLFMRGRKTLCTLKIEYNYLNTFPDMSQKEKLLADVRDDIHESEDSGKYTAKA